VAPRPSFVDRGRASLLWIARLLIVSLYVFSALEKVFDFEGAVNFAAGVGHIPFAKILMPFAIILELGCSALILTKRYCRIGATVLCVWTLFLGPWFHRFWDVQDPGQWQNVIDSFFHHLTMAGGLLCLAIVGAQSPASRVDCVQEAR
jgi:transmembrane protein